MNATLKANHTTTSLIESDAFPFEFLSLVAERESWRKEIHRPIYHLHKWWAKRLGSIFRGILLGAVLPEDSNLQTAFYQKQDFSNVVVFDPFMGSGTTLGEAHKLGCVALGCDINPVACESVRVALGPLDAVRLQEAFSVLAATVGQRIQQLYRGEDEQGREADVLYYFWVKQAPCPRCAAYTDLFSSYVIARNAYPDRKPEVQICCPRCGAIFPALNRDNSVACRHCELVFDPQRGPAQGAKATCNHCAEVFPIAETIRATAAPPVHRLYAKLILDAAGAKKYLPATEADRQAYQACAELLQRELKRKALRLPQAVLADGFNTRQAIGYNYTAWRDFFNDRQLLALGWLQEAIAQLPEVATRDALLLLFSGVLEFNNLFASYKGEGTGAVRHMFSHHILKPERMPIEANVWGTSKSSGSFSTLFKTRLFRALNYRAKPGEVALDEGLNGNSYSLPFSGCVEESWPVEGDFKTRGIYLSCGSSDATALPEACLDLVATDPPFFDNVHYSELADFFFAWQSLYPRGFIADSATTRRAAEVQDTTPEMFAAKLKAVFAECFRILKADGSLIFTYHHSRAEGWTALVEAIYGAGFSVINTHPVKAELSVAAPKAQAKEPIQLDVILVCRKRAQTGRAPLQTAEAVNEASQRAAAKLTRLADAGLKLSLNDKRIVLISQFIATLGPLVSAEQAIQALLAGQPKLEEAALQPLLATKVSKTNERLTEKQMLFSFEASQH
jgi:putative DNA methylase